jgi:hypothetical protein
MKKPRERLEMMRLAKREKLDRMWRRLIGDVGTNAPRRTRDKRRPGWAR